MLGAENGGRMSEAAPYHVFPTSEDMTDAWHGEHGPRVHLPRQDCALCRAGVCVQFELPDDKDIVLHGRWCDA